MSKNKSGIDNWNVAFAIVNALVPKERRRKINVTEKFERMEKYYEGVEFVLQQWTNGYKHLASAFVKSPFVRAYYYYDDKDKLERCLNLLLGGICRNEEDITMKTLERSLIDIYTQGNNPKNAYLKYAKTEHAIKAFMEGTVLTSIQCKVDVELFELSNEHI